MSPDEPTAKASVRRLSHGALKPSEAALIVEEPLQIIVDGAPYAVLMRTPGDDLALAAGFCLAEGLIDSAADLGAIQACEVEDANQVAVTRLGEHPPLHPARQTVASSCGLCGREMIADIMQRLSAITRPFTISTQGLLALGAHMQAAQQHFRSTGGAHAAALFDAAGEMLSFGEDVGRHNALDKAIGRLLLPVGRGRRPAPACDDPLREACVAVLSGRCSFEMVQKAARAGIPLLASVSAPTHLAVQLASQLHMTLVGFLRKDSLTIYCDGGHLEDLP